MSHGLQLNRMVRMELTEIMHWSNDIKRTRESAVPMTLGKWEQ